MNGPMKTSDDSKNSFSSGSFWLPDLAIITYIALANQALHIIAVQGFGKNHVSQSQVLLQGHLDHGKELYLGKAPAQN